MYVCTYIYIYSKDPADRIKTIIHFKKKILHEQVCRQEFQQIEYRQVRTRSVYIYIWFCNIFVLKTLKNILIICFIFFYNRYNLDIKHILSV